MKLRNRSIRAATTAFVLAVFYNVSLSAAASRRVAPGGSDGSFCSRPTIPVQAVPPPFKARLGVGRRSVRPGGKLRVRIEDLGTEDLAYGIAYGLARREAGSWVQQPTGPFLAPLSVVRAGTAGACQRIDIPGQDAPGLYRVQKWVEPVASRHHRTIAVTATFRVLRHR
jgi:hypothetical protein